MRVVSTGAIVAHRCCHDWNALLATLVVAVSVHGHSNVVDFGSSVLLGKRSLLAQGRLGQGLGGGELFLSLGLAMFDKNVLLMRTRVHAAHNEQ